METKEVNAKLMPVTLGESRVRVSFNVSGSTLVERFKQKSAELINVLEQMRAINNPGTKVNPEFERLLSLAQTDYESAAMWAVKAATI